MKHFGDITKIDGKTVPIVDIVVGGSPCQDLSVAGNREGLAGRICDQLRKDGTESPTMASLFDGIGGFPLVFSRCGCKPVWASEIEEFPIAVTKYHFKEAENERKN